MKAAVYDNPSPPTVLTYVDVPDPVCGPDDVLIAVEAISIEGGDLINRGRCPNRDHGSSATRQPEQWCRSARTFVVGKSVTE